MAEPHAVVRKQYGPLYDLFGEVKRIFDPQGILNPGKMLSNSPQDAKSMLTYLRAWHDGRACGVIRRGGD